MNLTCIPFSPFVENTYIMWTGEGGDAIVVDPGMMTDAERDTLLKFLDDNRLTLRHVLLTHMHIDHVASAQWLAEHYGLPVEGSRDDEFMGSMLPVQAQHFRLKIDIQPLHLGQYLKQGDTIALGDEQISVLEVPGHSPGSLVYYVPTSNFAITGDTLFAGSIGRTDLAGGDYGTLVEAINDKLLALPDDTLVYSGHGPATTIGDERRSNPFLA